MDANDAASYVQDLAGDDANIIFGAKFDESMTDEATITVIATGLETAGANAAGKIVPKMQYQNMGTVPRPTAPVTPRPAAQAGYTAPGTAKTRHQLLWYSETAPARKLCTADGYQDSGFP